METIPQLLAVCGVLALLLTTVLWLRKRGLATLALPGLRTTGTRKLELVERLSLTAQHSLHLVRVDNRTLLIGVSPTGCSLLETPAPAGAVMRMQNSEISTNA